MKSHCLAFILLSFFYFNSSYSQKKNNIDLGKITASTFTLPASPVIDSNTNAVIIADYGVTDFVGNKQGWLNHIFKRKTRIKILNNKGDDLSTVEIYLYKQDDAEEKLENLSASTYNLVNGQVMETKLGKDDVFTEKQTRNRIVKKFTMPAVVENSIIEYSYTVNSEFNFSIPSWEFQNADYPCLWSQYHLTLPSLLSYTMSRLTVHPFAVEKSEEGRASYKVIAPPDPNAGYAAQESNLTVSANTMKYTWAMKDVPPFFVENYLFSPRNYIDRIEFQLAGTNNGQDQRKVMNTWSEAINRLLESEDFGGALNLNNNPAADLVNEVTAGSTDQVSAAKAIYYYITRNFTCTNFYNKYVTTSLRDVVKKRSGGIGDINLLLISMLRQKGIIADPVLLSTREFGYNFPNYPMMERLNYVICKSVIGGSTYYLDASHSSLGFGYLPDDVYNGHARVISKTDTLPVYFNPGSIDEPIMTTISLFRDDKKPGSFIGKFQRSYGFQESYELRRTAEKKSMSDIFKEFTPTGSGDVEISNMGIDSVAKLELPVNVHYDFTLNTESTADHLYLNPTMGFGYAKNPFAAAERKYPVEMPYPIDETYVFYMQVPEGYLVEEVPKALKANFYDNGGFFEYRIQKDDKVIQLRTRLKLNRAIFQAEEYNALREFFAYVVKKQSEPIVLRKVK